MEMKCQICTKNLTNAEHPFSNYGYFFLQVFDEKLNTKYEDENLLFSTINTNSKENNKHELLK